MIFQDFPKPEWFGNLMMRTRIKICGITRPLDGLVAAQYGADAIGLVFHESSARHVTIEQACSIVSVLPPFVTIVGLFVNAPEYDVRRVIEQVPISLLQFHGDEKPEDCELYGKPYIKAVPMKQDVDLADLEHRYERAKALLLDTWVAGEQGGTGQQFDWNRVPHDLEKPLILAGGLTMDNVAMAVSMTRPFAVDVSSGVEAQTQKGIKDKEKISGFIRAVRQADTA